MEKNVFPRIIHLDLNTEKTALHLPSSFFLTTWERSFKGGKQKAKPVLDYQELTVTISLMKHFESWWQAFTGLV